MWPAEHKCVTLDSIVYRSTADLLLDDSGSLQLKLTELEDNPKIGIDGASFLVGLNGRKKQRLELDVKKVKIALLAWQKYFDGYIQNTLRGQPVQSINVRLGPLFEKLAVVAPFGDWGTVWPRKDSTYVVRSDADTANKIAAIYITEENKASFADTRVFSIPHYDPIDFKVSTVHVVNVDFDVTELFVAMATMVLMFDGQRPPQVFGEAYTELNYMSPEDHMRIASFLQNIEVQKHVLSNVINTLDGACTTISKQVLYRGEKRLPGQIEPDVSKWQQSGMIAVTPTFKVATGFAGNEGFVYRIHTDGNTMPMGIDVNGILGEWSQFPTEDEILLRSGYHYELVPTPLSERRNAYIITDVRVVMDRSAVPFTQLVNTTKIFVANFLSNAKAGGLRVWSTVRGL